MKIYFCKRYLASFQTNTKTAIIVLNMEEKENKENDHKKLGRELDLFTFSETVGKGLPLWTEKGAVIKRELERFIIDEETKRGYKHVSTPEIAKLDLYKKSGHYPYYKDSMYAPIKDENEEFMLRPMTCPHHFELYLRKPHSYRELPVRIAEVAKLYRYEQSGELMGLQRVRGFCLSDAHIICKDEEQAKSEINKALDLIEDVNKVLGLEKDEDYWYRLSLGDKNEKKKYFDNDEAWEKSEILLRELLQERKTRFTEAKDEAAFYGPKIDIQMKNANGKEDTAFTVQYDFSNPERFNLTYIDENGEEKQTIVIHRSSIGSIERTIAFLIEKYKGAFPVWLSPIQVKILPISENQNKFAEEVLEKLRAEKIRVETDDRNESLGKKIRDAKTEKIPYLFVIGDREMEENKVTIEGREEKIGGKSIDEAIEFIHKQVAEKK